MAKTAGVVLTLQLKRGRGKVDGGRGTGEGAGDFKVGFSVLFVLQTRLRYLLYFNYYPPFSRSDTFYIISINYSYLKTSYNWSN